MVKYRDQQKPKVDMSARNINNTFCIQCLILKPILAYYPTYIILLLKKII